MELVNESFEVIEGLCSLTMVQAPASATGVVHEALSAEVQDLSRSIQDDCRGTWSQSEESFLRRASTSRKLDGRQRGQSRVRRKRAPRLPFQRPVAPRLVGVVRGFFSYSWTGSEGP